MICPKCGSTAVSVQMVTNTTLQRAGHGLVWWLVVGWWWVLVKWFFFTFLALLAKIFAPKRYKITTEHRSVCVCQHCGYSGDAAEFSAPEPSPEAVVRESRTTDFTAPAPVSIIDTPHPSARAADEECEVVGESYHRDEIASLGELSRVYYVPRDRLFGSFVEGDVLYKYQFERMAAELVPEPDNPHDADAIRVEVAGVTMGYIPRKDTERVRALLDGGADVVAEITAGPDKIITDAGGVLNFETRERDFSVRLCFYRRAPVAPIQCAAPPVVEGQAESKVPAALLWVCVAALVFCTGCLAYMAFFPAPESLTRLFPVILGAAILSGGASFLLAGEVDF